MALGLAVQYILKKTGVIRGALLSYDATLDGAVGDVVGALGQAQQTGGLAGAGQGFCPQVVPADKFVGVAQGDAVLLLADAQGLLGSLAVCDVKDRAEQSVLLGVVLAADQHPDGGAVPG